MPNDFEISYKQEVVRKSIHMVSLSIPIVYSFITKELALSILIPMTILSIIIDFASRKKSKFREFFHKIFGKILRPHEFYDVFTLNGATWVLISAVVCIIIFPKTFVVTGFSILIISDISSALIGRKFGKHPLFVRKSWEGTSAFWISAILVIIVIGNLLSAPWTFYFFGVIAAFVGGIAEAASTMLKMDDNLSIPLSIGIVLWAGEFISVNYFHLSYINLLM
jgi:dolichol kinase